MTEPSPIEIEYSKPQVPSQEAQKRKKSSKKKAEPLAADPRREIFEAAIPDLTSLTSKRDFDLVHHTNKLEQQLVTAKRQLKQQKQKFRQVIHGLAKYFDERGVSPQAIEEYIKNLGTQIAENQERESDYEQFFTVHKYHIVEDPNTLVAKSLPKVGQKAENGPKNTPKSLSTSVKLDTTDPGQIPIDLTVSAPIEKPEKKKGRPPKNANGNGTEEPKKRKSTKHKQSEEVITVPDIQEIPPLEFPKKIENKVKKAEDTIRGYEEISQKPIDLGMIGQPNFGIDDGLKNVVKQMGLDPSALMNPYMAGAFGVQEGEMYNKLFQELMKANSPNPMLNTDKARQELFNYYQGNFK